MYERIDNVAQQLSPLSKCAEYDGGRCEGESNMKNEEQVIVLFHVLKAVAGKVPLIKSHKLINISECEGEPY